MIGTLLAFMLAAIAVGVYAADYRLAVDPECNSIAADDKNDSAVREYLKQMLLLHGSPSVGNCRQLPMRVVESRAKSLRTYI